MFKTAQSVIDSVADKGIFHKNKAARLKSRLAAKVKALALAGLKLREAAVRKQEGPALRALCHWEAESLKEPARLTRAARTPPPPASWLSRAKFMTKSQAMGSMPLSASLTMHALHAVDDLRHAVRRVADVGADAALPPPGLKAGHGAGQALGPVAGPEGAAFERDHPGCRTGGAWDLASSTLQAWRGGRQKLVRRCHCLDRAGGAGACHGRIVPWVVAPQHAWFAPLGPGSS